MHVKNLFLFFCFSLSICPIYSQKKDTIFSHPLDIPVALSATFGELRANHFHSGIDFRTQGVTGHKVYAVERGYISRISVSSGGFGNALYLTHPNGYTSVYGHLDAFNDKLAEYLKLQQYKQEKFSLNLYPDSVQFPVKRGELIAFSGNTGSSGGPHLHFEIRDTKTEKPINPLQFGFGVKDNIPPVILRLAVYPIGEGSAVNGSADKIILELEKSGKNYRIAGGKKINAMGNLAFGIETYDQINGSANRCGPYNISLWIDSVKIFSQTMERFSFNETRYINSLIDYEYYMNNRIRINRMYIEPNNLLSVYDRFFNRGVASFPDSAKHTAFVVVSDYHGNSSRLNFSFDYLPEKIQFPLFPPNISEMMPSGISIKYQKDFSFTQAGIHVFIPANALYDDISFTCTSSAPPKGLYSKSYKIHHRGTPLHQAMTIEISADSLPERLREKAIMVLIEPDGKHISAGGAFRDGVVTTLSSVFGEFAIGVDTVPPRITPVNIKNGADMRGSRNIRFKITDNFSGINTYNGWIDGQWALFEYDAKNNLIFYNFDKDRLTKNTQHTLELNITDNKGNTAEYRAKFTW